MKKCLNEWNAIIEALGQGKQTILIRNYGTNLKEFLLFPTVSYALNDNYIDNFQTKYQEFVKKNTFPKKINNKSKIKYFAKVINVIERSSFQIGSLKKHYIWTSKHVKSYLNTKKAYIWILRVYELENTIMAERTMGMRYSNLFEPVSIEKIKPILTDIEFNKIIKDIKL